MMMVVVEGESQPSSRDTPQRAIPSGYIPPTPFQLRYIETMESGCPRMHRVSAGGRRGTDMDIEWDQRGQCLPQWWCRIQGHAPFRLDHSVNEVLMDAQVNENN